MRLKTFYITFITIIFSTAHTFGQYLGYDGSYQVFKTINKKNLTDFKDVEGSPYIQDSYLPVKLMGHENKEYQGRYNAYSGEMEIKDANKLVALDNRNHFDVLFNNSN